MGITDPIRDHGGDLAGAAARFGSPAEPWIDLSTGINPWAWPWPGPMAPVDAAAWHRLPDRAALAGLKDAAASFYGCAPPTVAAAPGSQALIQVLPRLVARGRVQVVGPTYAEHARCWARAGHSVETVDAPALAEGPVVVLGNPNNPDGRAHAPGDLLDLADRLAARGGALVVDEAFAEVRPEVSVAPWAGRPGLVVLRSFGKFFGLAGLRLGFALAEPALVAAIEDELGPWSVSGPALAIGASALADRAWRESARAMLAERASALDAVLSGNGIEVVGGTSLFRLVSDARAARIHEALGRAGILVRAFEARADWLRFGLPGDPAGLARLDRALRDALGRMPPG